MALYTDYDSPSTVDYDVFAINNAIKNILFTQIGSVPGKPDFGSRLYELIFGQIDHITISQLKKLIQEPLYRWEKRIKVIDVKIKSIPEYNRLLAEITYQYVDDVLNRQNSVTLNLLET